MDNRPIGVFDSGIGGLTVLRKLEEILPNEKFIYLGDTLNFPYGEKSKEEILGYSEKNIEFLLNAQQKLIEKRINNIKLLIVGDGPDKENYINITRKLNIFDKVIFTGKIEQDKIQYYYQCADAFVTASNSETQGLTVIEAMAAGVVPICINDMAFIDMLPKKSLFNNQNEYINRLITFSTDEELRKEYKVEIRKKAEEYSSNTYAQRVLNVYSGVLNGGKKDNTLKSRELINEKKKMVEEFV